MSKTYQPAGLEVRQSHNIFLSSHIPPPTNKITLQLIYLGHFCNYSILEAISWVIITADGSFEQINSCHALPHKIAGFSKLKWLQSKYHYKEDFPKIPQTRAVQKYENGKLMPFLVIGAVKRKRYRRSENKKNKYFAIIRKNKAVSTTLRLRQIHGQMWKKSISSEIY